MIVIVGLSLIGTVALAVLATVWFTPRGHHVRWAGLTNEEVAGSVRKPAPATPPAPAPVPVVVMGRQAPARHAAAVGSPEQDGQLILAAIRARAALRHAQNPIPPWPGTSRTGSFRAVAGGR